MANGHQTIVENRMPKGSQDQDQDHFSMALWNSKHLSNLYNGHYSSPQLHAITSSQVQEYTQS